MNPGHKPLFEENPVLVGCFWSFREITLESGSCAAAWIEIWTDVTIIYGNAFVPTNVSTYGTLLYVEESLKILGPLEARSLLMGLCRS